MTTRIQDNQTRGLFLLVLFIVLFIHVCTGNAQPIKRLSFYRGFEASFGQRTYKMTSNINNINHGLVTNAGGRIGVLMGSEILKIRATVGYYSSVNKIKGTVDLYDGNVSLNLYPLGLSPNKVQPYVIGGVAIDRTKLYGYSANDQASRNYSVSEAPFIGALNTLRTFAGMGVDVKVLEAETFLHLFGEGSYSTNVNENSGAFLSQTKTNSGFLVNIGVRFGSRHN